MQKTKAICLTTCLASLLVSSLWAVNLKDAIKQKLVKASVKWASNSDEQSNSERYGKHINLELKNLTNKSIDVDVPCGFVFYPNDSTKQNMIITEQLAYNLKPKEAITKYAFAYCCESHDGGPSENEVYNPGKMAKEALVKLANFIHEKKYQNYGAQRAIWCLSNNNPIEEIYADSAQEVRDLINFTGNLKGYTASHLDSLATKIIKKHKKVETTLHCSIPFEQNTYMWAMVEDVNNVNFKTVITKRPIEKGVFERNFSFSSIDYPSGDYVLRVYSTTQPVVEIPFTLEK